VLQGARLTAWELMQEGIPVTLITDNTAGALMKMGEIDLVIVGTDRTARNGDVANKIGTYTLAVLCRENKIPFYVAAPLSSIDFSITSGELIPIEEREPEEVIYVMGKCRIAADGIRARNIAFDVTPHKYVTAIITERGAFRPKDLKKLMKINNPPMYHFSKGGGLLDENIKTFVRQTLGCGCPEEVFEYIDCQTNITLNDIMLRNRINIGNRLLIYIVEVNKGDSLKNVLPFFINMGKKEKDDLKFNRFRLVLASDNIDETKKAAEDIFKTIDRDEKVHLHVILKADIPILSNL
jgi:hypothetical protein